MWTSQHPSGVHYSYSGLLRDIIAPSNTSHDPPLPNRSVSLKLHLLICVNYKG